MAGRIPECFICQGCAKSAYAEAYGPIGRKRVTEKNVTEIPPGSASATAKLSWIEEDGEAWLECLAQIAEEIASRSNHSETRERLGTKLMEIRRSLVKIQSFLGSSHPLPPYSSRSAPPTRSQRVASCPFCDLSFPREKLLPADGRNSILICRGCVMGAWELTAGAIRFYRLKKGIALDLPSRGKEPEELVEWVRLSMLEVLRQYRQVVEELKAGSHGNGWEKVLQARGAGMIDQCQRIIAGL